MTPVSFTYIFLFTIFIFSLFLLTINFISLEISSDNGSTSKLISRPDTLHSKKLFRKREIQLNKIQSCKPASYGIPLEKDSIYFSSPNIFPSCEIDNPDFLSLSNYSLFTSCTTEPSFIYGPSTDQEFFGNFPKTYNWKPQSEFTHHKNTEWIISKCGKSKNVLLRNVFNPAAANRAKNITKLLTKQYKTETYRPITVLLIVIDSVSRQSFYRNL